MDPAGQVTTEIEPVSATPGSNWTPLQTWVYAAVALAASAVMLFWGGGLRPWWPLMWFAPLPVLMISPRLGGWRAFLTASAVWFAGSLNMWHYMLSNSFPLFLVVVILVVPSCLFGLGVVLFRKFALRGAVWRAALVFPAYWVTLEYVNCVTSRHGTFANLGYTQMDFLPVLQVTSLVGIWGISFCLCLLPAAIAAVLGVQGRERVRLAVAVGAFLAAVIGFGGWRLISTPPPQQTLQVGLMASGVGTTFPLDDDVALALLRFYADQATSLAAQSPQLIVLPEKIALASDQLTSQIDAVYSTTAARASVSIMIGLDRGTRTKRVNEARLYSPGAPVETYVKHHLLPPFENADRPGTALTVLDEPSGTWGIEICKDMDFPRLSREYGSKGVGLLLVPAWDFTNDAWLHGRMAVMRGVESGFTIARAAKQGLLTVSDDRGRILAQQDAASVPFASLVATAPVRHDDTLYARWGDWFAWLNIAGLIVILFSPSRKPQP